MPLNMLIFLIFCICLVFTSTAKTSAKKTSGSYITVLNRIVPCEHPIVPYMKDPKGFLEIGLKNNVVKGNFTITGKNNNLQATMQDMYYIDGKWQTTFMAKNMSCRGKWISLMLDFLGVHYNKKTCAVPKGSYVFEVDYNKLDHIWMPLREYGKMLRRLEAHSKAGTVVCSEFESDINPMN